MPLLMQKQASRQEYETGMWENGTYAFTLRSIRVGVQHDSFNDVDRVRAQFVFEDEDGDALESNTINLTKNLAFNDRSKFFEYLGALHGEKIKDSDEVIVDMPGVNEWADAEALPRFYTSGEAPVTVNSITVNGIEVIGNGKKVNITLSKELSAKGNNYNKIVTIAPQGGGGKVKRPQAERPAGMPE